MDDGIGFNRHCSASCIDFVLTPRKPKTLCCKRAPYWDSAHYIVRRRMVWVS